MQPAVLLRCPMCNAVHALAGRRSEYSKQDLYATAKVHLSDHNLNEPKTAIRKYGIMSDAVEIVVPSEDRRQLPIGEWKERDNTWLPDGVLSGEDAPLQVPKSPV